MNTYGERTAGYVSPDVYNCISNRATPVITEASCRDNVLE